MSDPVTLDGRSPRHSLPFIYPAQAQKEYLVNEAFSALDCLVSPVILAESATPPSTAENGDAFIIASGASDVWTGRDERIAYWAGNQWVFLEPHEGMTVWDASAGQFSFYRGSWTRASTPTPATGGAVVDAEARGSLSDLIHALENIGVFSQS